MTTVIALQRPWQFLLAKAFCETPDQYRRFVSRFLDLVVVTSVSCVPTRVDGSPPIRNPSARWTKGRRSKPRLEHRYKTPSPQNLRQPKRKSFSISTFCGMREMMQNPQNVDKSAPCRIVGFPKGALKGPVISSLLRSTRMSEGGSLVHPHNGRCIY